MTSRKTPPPKPLKRAQGAKKIQTHSEVPAKPSKGSKEPVYTMPKEVSDWIERAQSIMNHQRGQIESLKAENEKLKSYRKWAEQRILRSEHESQS
jgi:uncharacterized protein YecA (UPF0149 family)